MSSQSIIRQSVLDVVTELATQGMRLAEIASSIQLPRDFGSEVEFPNTFEIELYSRIQAVKKDYIQPCVETLTAAAHLTDFELQTSRLACRSRPRFCDTALAKRVNERMRSTDTTAEAPRFSESLQEALARRTADLLTAEGEEEK
jgi:hypothetical protein